MTTQTITTAQAITLLDATLARNDGRGIGRPNRPAVPLDVALAVIEAADKLTIRKEPCTWALVAWRAAQGSNTFYVKDPATVAIPAMA